MRLVIIILFPIFFILNYNLFSADGVIDLKDVILMINNFATADNDENFDTYFDLNNDGLIDCNDYRLLMKSYESKIGDEKYNQNYDIYPYIKKSSAQKSTETANSASDDYSETIEDKNVQSSELDKTLPIKSESIFVKSNKFNTVKKILEEIKYSDSKIVYSEKDNMISISDSPYWINEYIKIINFINNNSKVHIQNKKSFCEIYKIPTKSENTIYFGNWILYNDNTLLLFDEKYISNNKFDKQTFALDNVTLEGFVNIMNKKIGTRYFVTPSISNNKISIYTKHEIPYPYLLEIFISTIELYGYRVYLNKIDYPFGLNNLDSENAVVVFYYKEELKNFKKAEKLLENELIRLKLIPYKNICLILGNKKSINEFSEKWEKLRECFSSNFFKKYTIQIYKPEILVSRLYQYLSIDKGTNELNNYKNLAEEIKICPLNYNNSIFISFPEELEEYMDKTFFQLEQPDEDKYDFTSVINIIYNNAEEITEFLTKLYAEEKDKINIVFSKVSNSIILKSKSKIKMDEVVRTIKKLDRKPLQVLIKTLIAEVKLDETNRFGLEWKFGDKNQQGGFESNLRKADLSLTNPLNGLKYSLLNSNKYDVFFNALKNNSELNILSKPQIMTKNNTPAKIIIGKEVPIIKITNANSDEDDNNNALEFQTNEKNEQTIVVKHNLSTLPSIGTEYKEVGITLEVTPNISDNNTIMLNLKQIVSEIESTGLLENPIINKREASTVIVVDDNNTVVIGGMIKKDKNKSEKKVPVLSKIPLIGKTLFTSTEETLVNTELLIFITPIIVTDSYLPDIKQGLKQELK